MQALKDLFKAVYKGREEVRGAVILTGGLHFKGILQGVHSFIEKVPSASGFYEVVLFS